MLPSAAVATHNLAGQITYRRLGPNVYEITITTYTDPCAAGVDRCEVPLEIWGIRGTTKVKVHEEMVKRVNGPIQACSWGGGAAPNGERVAGYSGNPCVKRNLYITTYRFDGPGQFELRFWDIARVQSVRNIRNATNNVAVYFETLLNNQPFIGVNNSPLLLNEPLDNACTNRLWTHNPGGFDPDGDSLAYKFVPCRDYQPPILTTPIVAAGYSLPNVLGGGALTINPITGVITWNTPQQVGQYNLAFMVEEWRNGRLIGYVIRDMAVNVLACDNRPPVIEAPDSLCHKPGDLIRFRVTAYDPDLNRQILPGIFMNRPDDIFLYLNNGPSGNNGPFAVEQNRARFEAVVPRTPNPPVFPIKFTSPRPNERSQIEVDFVWQTDCSHLRETFYQVDFYAHDNMEDSRGNRLRDILAANHVTRIYLVPEAVENLQAEPGPRRITLTWQPHSCENALGYDIYRALSEDAIVGDPKICCASGVRGAPPGYELIGRTEGHTSTTYVDLGVDEGLEYRSEYCYRVVARFPRNVRSCASPAVCQRIFRDRPVLVRDSIDVTGRGDGSLVIRWLPPDLTKIQQDIYPPPYFYLIERSRGSGTGGAFIRVPIEPKEFTDTSFVDTGLDTETTGWAYRIVLTNRSIDRPDSLVAISTSDRASSVFLSIEPVNRSLRLTWRERVPWTNESYEIWRSVGQRNGPYELVATVEEQRVRVNDQRTVHSWTDPNLDVTTDYYYYIRSIGGYKLDNIIGLVNASNIAWARPVDTIPPCLPNPIKTEADCDRYRVRFSWAAPPDSCGSDIEYYTLYFSERRGGPWREVGRTQAGRSNEMIFDNALELSITGCYVMTATDSTGNESKYSTEFCVENCPLFTLPNVFTPNGDGWNDILNPMIIRSIRSLRFQVYDRWGVLLHTSTDPLNLWDGRTTTGAEAASGQYFYKVELTFDNLEQSRVVRTGSFTLLR
jgi:gliding motility-associated-like protein